MLSFNSTARELRTTPGGLKLLPLAHSVTLGTEPLTHECLGSLKIQMIT